MSSKIAVRIENLSKCYHIYDAPQDRLKQFLMPRLRKLFGLAPRNYFREFWSLRDVSFEVERGEVIGIIGRNGSGKSTLLQLICGTLSPTSGTVQTHGRIAALLELGSGFNPEFTGRENVYLNAAILGLSKEETDRKYDEILAFADIGDFIGQPVKTYSSGMAVRLAFAVASSVDPDILIVDEALAVGDAAFQAKCFRRFNDLRARGVTVLLVTHDIGAVVQLCDRAFVLHQGKMVASGSPKHMADEYRRRCAEADGAGRIQVLNVGGSAGEKNESHVLQWMQKSLGTQEYGDGYATIEEFALLDDQGNPAWKIMSGELVTLRTVIRFHHKCEAPIMAFGIRDLAGQELCGTNSWFEDCDIGSADVGRQVEMEFRFSLPLQAGGYNLSLACTELNETGLTVHHRLYDVMTFEVVAARKFVGRFDVKPSITLLG